MPTSDLGKGAGKGRASTKPFIDNYPQCVLITGKPGFPLQLLRSHVDDGPCYFLDILRTRTLCQKCHAKVTQEDLCISSKEHVLWFDVPMDKFFPMCILQSTGNLGHI